MTNRNAPTMAELTMELTIGKGVPVVQMSILREDPTKMHVTFGSAVKKIPEGLPTQVFVSQEVKPVEYHLQ